MTEGATGDPAQSGSQPADKPFDSFATLRRAHVELRKSLSDASRDPRQAHAAAADVRSYIARVQQTGAILTDESERRAAQGILDYWTAELAGTPGATARDYLPMMLAMADPQRASPAEQTDKPTEPQIQGDYRDIIRFAAAARLWRDSGKKHVYLLSGEAIAQAAKFRDANRDIADLVAASEAARSSSRKRIFYISGTALVVAFSLIFTYLAALPWISNYLTSKIRQKPPQSNWTATQKANTLWWLGHLQPFLRPFDLSGGGAEFEKIRMPTFTLDAPNFSQAKFLDVNFEDARLANASFIQSDIGGRSTFARANLSFAQFGKAQVDSTSFADAELYRASFDRACIRDVNFSGTDLRSTSFWGVAFDSKVAPHFENTGWWFAQGWSSSNIKKLLKLDQSKLANTKYYKTYINQSKKLLDGIGAGTLERALALNDLAWTFATWGFNADAIKNRPQQTCGQAMSRTDIPDDALDAAEQAVCITKTLNETGDTKGKLDRDLANNQDTLAYLLMQAGRMTEADVIYRDIASKYEDAEVLFRAAIAQYVVGDKEEAAAKFKKSMILRYAPSHELQHLQKHLPEEFWRDAYELIDKIWPTAETTCQF